MREALRGVDFAIRPGETVALVRENGAGETALVKLLTRLGAVDPVGAGSAAPVPAGKLPNMDVVVL